MRKKLFTLLLAVAASVGTMFAWDYERVQIGDLYYNLDATNHAAEVTYRSYTNYKYNEGWGITTANIPASVEYNSVDYSVTSIGNSAFSSCWGLTSLTIPNSVTSIGWYAFSSCWGLTSVIVENGNTVYDSRNNCNAIIETATNTLIAGCKNTTIPNSVTSIGYDAFYECTGLTSMTIPNSVTSIGNRAFCSCSGLTSVTIPKSVTSIGDYAFRGCSGLTSVTIPNRVTSIGEWAFYGCSGLTSVTIPNSVTSIGERAFYGCYGLTSVTIPNSVTSIGHYAFLGCTGLTSINVASDNSNYCSVDGVLFNKDKTSLIQYPGGKQGAYTIPNSVTSIGYGAFFGCYGLTSVTISNSVTSIGLEAFSGCSSLTSVTIPNIVTSIGEYAFRDCTGLTSVTIPNSVTSIGVYAFRECSGLTSITCEATTPPTLKSGVFYGVNKSIPVYVSYESIDLYKTSNGWKDFTNILPKDAYWVEFIDWDGTKIQSGWVKENTAAIPPLDPVREGYTFYGWDKSFSKIQSDLIVTALYLQKPPTDMTTDEMGAIKGVFSVAEGRQVVFSKGNLQYNAAQGTHACADGTTQQGTWRFAENQMEIRAYENSNRSETYDGWIDLFHYGASGYNGMIPYRNTPADAAMYQQVGALQGSYYDFGLYNAISNGGNQPGIWRLFTQNEWYYIVRDRANALRLRAHATINGVEGLIILPDNCDTTALRNIASYNPSDYVMNNYSLTAWKSIEALGVVFLPVSGAMDYRFSYLVWDGNSTHYMCAYSSQLSSISCASFSTNHIGSSTSSATAISVRLVQDVDVFHLNAVSNNSAWGTVTGETQYWNEPITVTATPNEGYRFVQWSDGITDNPRAFSLATDSTITAEFAPNTFTLNVTCDAEQGLITGESGAFDYLSEHTFKAIANHGYTFDRWSDGVTDNPRTVVITQDTTITAIFTINHYPVVLLDHDGKLLSKQSVAYNHAAEAPEVPAREGYTFTGWTTDIEHITDTTYVIAVYDKIGGTVIYKAEDGEIIGSENVDLHLPAAPMISGKTFAGWLTESVDSESGIVLRATYTTDNPTTHDDVSVVPGSTTAAVNFPYITGALTYELVIRDLFGHVVCKILFNSTGHLLGIALAPGRDRSAAPAQTDGFNFTVEGLDPNTTYNYEFVAHDDTDEVIETLSGSFTTTDDTPTGMENAQSNHAQCKKELRNDHVYILRGEKVYTLAGQEVIVP